MPEPLLISARQQTCPGWRTIRSRYVTIREPHPTGRELVEMRRGDVLAAVKADVGVAHVIADDEDDVGFVAAVAAEMMETTAMRNSVRSILFFQQRGVPKLAASATGAVTTIHGSKLAASSSRFANDRWWPVRGRSVCAG
jgi:hypothetical protein